jgi:large subunit ribosomal protein L22
MKAYQTNIRQTPRKLARIGNLLRGKNVVEAQAILANLPHKASRIILKLLGDSVANALVAQRRLESLYVDNVRVDMCAKYRRFDPRAQGRVNTKTVRTSSVSVLLATR